MIHHLIKQNRRRTFVIFYIGIFFAAQTCQAIAAEVPLSSIEGQRLFTTQQERNNLDKARLKLLLKDKKEPAKRVVVAPRPIPAVQMRGFIKRSDGKTTTWLNQGNTLKSRTVGNVNVSKAPNAAGGVKVTLPNGKTITLKPGQKYDPLTGRIKSIY